jgi:hypothetical protein
MIQWHTSFVQESLERSDLIYPVCVKSFKVVHEPGVSCWQVRCRDNRGIHTSLHKPVLGSSPTHAFRSQLCQGIPGL